MTKLGISVGILAAVFCLSVRAQTINVMVLDQAGAQTILQAARENAQQQNEPCFAAKPAPRNRAATPPRAAMTTRTGEGSSWFRKDQASLEAAATAYDRGNERQAATNLPHDAINNREPETAAGADR